MLGLKTKIWRPRRQPGDRALIVSQKPGDRRLRLAFIKQA